MLALLADDVIVAWLACPKTIICLAQRINLGYKAYPNPGKFRYKQSS